MGNNWDQEPKTLLVGIGNGVATMAGCLADPSQKNKPRVAI